MRIVLLIVMMMLNAQLGDRGDDVDDCNSSDDEGKEDGDRKTPTKSDMTPSSFVITVRHPRC